MNEPKQSIWEKSWDWETPTMRSLGRIGGLARKVIGFFTLARVAFLTASIITLIALFYSVENWRGKSSWEARKKELAAQGVNLDWDSYVATNRHLIVHVDAEKSGLVRQLLQKPTVTITPPKFGAAIMPYRHVGAFKEYPPTYEMMAALPERNTNALSVEKLANWGGTNTAVDLEKHLKMDRRDSAVELAQASGFKLILNSQKKINLGGGWLHERMIPALKEKGSLELLTMILKADGLTVTGAPGRQEIEAEPDISRDTLRSWFELNRPWMEELFESLRREGMKLELDTNNPTFGTVQNYVGARTLAQTFSTGAKLELVDRNPERARFYLEGQEALMSFLSEPPHTLILAMIKVAVCGLHVDVVADGLRSGAFRADDLRGIRTNLGKINLLADVAQSWGGWEMLGVIHAVEKMPRKFWVDSLIYDRDNRGLKTYLRFAPEGWYFQNLLGLEEKGESLLKAIDEDKRVMEADQIDRLYAEVTEEFSHTWRPYEVLQRRFFPNAQRSLQTVAFNQSRLHMLIVAAALEEFRLKTGKYPHSLSELVPQYLGKIPNDVIDGHPMHYRLEAEDSFVLYSVGWNGKDEGGVVKVSEYPTSIPQLGMVVYSKDRSQGDWVFRSKPLVRE